jgi:hypothetical protein
MMSAVPFARRGLVAALVLLLSFSFAPPATAQQQLQGRVLLKGEGVAGVPVQLHRVTRDTAGVVATTTTAAGGGFSMVVPPTDTAGFTVFFATAEFRGIRYFGTPLHPQDSWDEYGIAVFDTVPVGAAEVPVRLARRDLVLLPDPAGGWEVNEIVRLVNPGAQTLVARQAMPTWEFRVPAAAEGIEVGEGDLDAAEIARMGDRILLNAPIIPGLREIFVRYRIPARAGEFRIPVETTTDSLNVFVQQPAPAIVAAGLSRREGIQAEGAEFHRFGAADLGGGSEITIGWNPGGSPIDPTIAALAVLSLLLVVGAIAAVWRRPGSGSGGRPPTRTVAVGSVVREPESAGTAV